MARRCGCAGSVCSCFVVGTGNATVSGSGSDVDPYTVDVDAAVIQVADTATLDLVIAGAGTPASPYILSGNVLGGGGGGLSTEQIMDYLGGVTTPGQGLIGAGLITVAYDDTGNKITFGATRTESYLLARANHTGEIPLASMASDWMVSTAPTPGQVPLWDGDSWEAAAFPSTSTFATKAGGVGQMSDWSTTSPPSGVVVVPLWDSTLGKYVPTDIAGLVAVLDAAGRINEATLPKYTLRGAIFDEGDPAPADFPVSAVGLTRPAAASLVPTLLDDNFANNAVASIHNVVLTTPEVLAVGDVIGFSVAWSNEAVTPDHFDLAYSVGAGALSPGTMSLPNTTMGCLDGYAVITTQVPAGSTITVNCRDSAGATQNRVHMLAAMYRLPGLAASPRDQQAVGGATSSSVLSAINAGPTSGPTAVPNELAVGSAAWSSGVTPVTRVLAGTGGWTQISQQKSETTASARSMFVGYKVLTSIQQPQLTTQMTASDGATGTWAAHEVTYKAA